MNFHDAITVMFNLGQPVQRIPNTVSSSAVDKFNP